MIYICALVGWNIIAVLQCVNVLLCCEMAELTAAVSLKHQPPLPTRTQSWYSTKNSNDIIGNWTSDTAVRSVYSNSVTLITAAHAVPDGGPARPKHAVGTSNLHFFFIMHFYSIALLLLLPLSTYVRTAEVYFAHRFPFFTNLCLGPSCSRRTFHVALLYRAWPPLVSLGYTNTAVYKGQVFLCC